MTGCRILVAFLFLIGVSGLQQRTLPSTLYTAYANQASGYSRDKFNDLWPPYQGTSVRASSSSDDDGNKNVAAGDDGMNQETEPIRTLGGGAEMIFAMSHQMLLWDETEDAIQYQRSGQPPPSASSLLRKYQVGGENSDSAEVASATGTSKRRSLGRKKAPVLPRWRPLTGISDVNPSFRTQSPMMNSQGYAGIIWKNARKANKPSLWRHALRTYDRMDSNPATKMNDRSSSSNDSNKNMKVQRTMAHHEGALVACAKLGWWRKAMEIYKEVERQQQSERQSYKKVYVTDNMVLSLIRACVQGSKSYKMEDDRDATSLAERRAPLDACLEVLLRMENAHGLPLVARHLNSLVAAYQDLGLIQDAAALLSDNLEDRTSGPEDENGMDPLNINDIRSKDKASYSLLVKGNVCDGNWVGAIEALTTMTESGLYPNNRHLNAWTEISERKTRQRATRSWKKKRDEYWLESVR